jgi:DNA-binding CsgD family transcriptional regulator
VPGEHEHWQKRKYKMTLEARQDLRKSRLAYSNTTERNRQMVALRNAGKTYVEIGRQFGLCPERVRKIIVRHTYWEKLANAR